MRATLLELPARFGALSEQLDRVRAQVRPGSTDLLVLPEAALTGYVSPRLQFDLSDVAEALDLGVQRLADLARSLECDVVGPVIERTAGGCFNSMVAVGSDGVPWLHYRKRHPWFPETWATPGDLAWPLVERHGLRFTCALCFDVHFLAEEAAPVLERADVLLFPSAWVDEHDTLPGLLTGVSTRFQLTALNANWGRGSPRLPGQGGSLVTRPDGTSQRLVRGITLELTV